MADGGGRGSGDSATRAGEGNGDREEEEEERSPVRRAEVAGAAREGGATKQLCNRIARLRKHERWPPAPTNPAPDLGLLPLPSRHGVVVIQLPRGRSCLTS